MVVWSDAAAALFNFYVNLFCVDGAQRPAQHPKEVSGREKAAVNRGIKCISMFKLH